MLIIHQIDCMCAACGAFSAIVAEITPNGRNYPKCIYHKSGILPSLSSMFVMFQMVRTYKPKGKRLNWNQEQLQNAITDIRSKTFTIRAASRYGIPRTTLQDMMHRANMAEAKPSKIGRKPVQALTLNMS